MASKTSAPMPKKGTYDGSTPYGLGDREAFSTPKQISNGGLQSICPGEDGEKGTSTPEEVD